MPPRVIDSHCHAFPDAIAAGAIKTLEAGAKWEPARAFTDGTVSGLLASMDGAGVERAICCSVATRPTQVRKITDWSAATASSRIIAFASIHPDFDSPEAECERIASLGLRGIKYHPQYMNCPVDDPRTYRIARAATAAGLALTFHAGYDLAYDRDDFASPASLRRLFDAVPGIRLLCCHLGGWERWEESLEHLVGLPLWLETSYSLAACKPDVLEKILARHPATHLLWGTDSPWNDHAADLARFRSLRISEAARSAALWDNALAYLNMRD